MRGTMLIADVQLRGITRGLDYLHSNEVIHGDLKGVSGASNYQLSRSLTRRTFL